MRARSRTILLVGGWSWHRHVGDDAILRAHLDEFARALPGCRVMVVCGEPDRLAERMGVDAIWSAAPAISRLLGPGLAHDEISSADLLDVVDAAVAAALDGRDGELPCFAPLVAAIERADAVVAAAAGSLTGAYPLTVAEQVVVLRAAQELGKPTVVSGASLGPFDDPADEDLLRRALCDADLVTVREASVSAGRARALGVAGDRLRVQRDPAFWMAPAPVAAADAALGRAGIDPRRRIGLLTVARWPGGRDQVQPLAQAIDAVGEAAGLAFLGVPMYLPPAPVPADDAALDAVAAASARGLARLDPLPDDPALLTLSGRARVVVGARFHGAVLAAAAGTPAVLVHDGAYQRDKAESLAAAVPAVRAVPLAAGADAIVDATLAALERTPAPLRPDGPLPAVAWLAERLRGRAAPAGLARRLLRRARVA